jgi:YfiH family protein
VCEPLGEIAAHLFTTRSWSLGEARGRTSGWQEVATSLGYARSGLVRLHQVHGRSVVMADREDGRREALLDGDILIARSDARLVAVQAADCVPLLMADRRLGVVAAAHAGWRGLAAGVPRATVDALVETYGSDPRDLIAAVGPAISSCCYEVGEDVREAFAGDGFEPGDLDRWFHRQPTPTRANPSMPGLPSAPRPGHAYFDGWQSAVDQLSAAGVAASRIFSARLCTASHPKVFPSYRRDGAVAGRLAGAIAPGGQRA